MNSTIKNIKKTISKNRMIETGDVVMAAVSGGIDSITLLDILGRLRQELSFSLVVCHLNHNLRGKESERDFNFVKKTALELGLEFEGRKLKAGVLEGDGESLQALARKKRYEFFEKAAKKHGANRIALGHTLDDQAETVLMRLLKGASLSGLCGIPPVRGPYIRPLIETSRQEIEKYSDENGLEFVQDSSNLTDKYLRNDIRLNLIPFLKENYNPNITETLARTSSILSPDDDFINMQAEEAYKKCILERKGLSVSFDRLGLLSLHKAILSRLLIKAVEELKLPIDIYSFHIKSFLNILESRRPNISVNLPSGLSVAREYDKVIISAEAPKTGLPFSAVLKVPGTTLLKDSPFSLKTTVLTKIPESFGKEGDIAFFDYDDLALPITVRPMQPGDRIVPFGMKGSKKLKDIFIEKKIPKCQRLSIPVLAAGEVIIWAAGVRQSDLFKVTENTKRALKIELRNNGSQAGRS
ncbi:MAG: tRNA lysidine(34) synthetase TilS [Deltaproteobacteria bacterium]|nr:tRNA lysidine(34) synthetase TilS [Deltaproteobacteria bacterium]